MDRRAVKRDLIFDSLGAGHKTDDSTVVRWLGVTLSGEKD